MNERKWRIEKAAPWLVFISRAGAALLGGEPANIDLRHVPRCQTSATLRGSRSSHVELETSHVSHVLFQARAQRTLRMNHMLPFCNFPLIGNQLSCLILSELRIRTRLWVDIREMKNCQNPRKKLNWKPSGAMFYKLAVLRAQVRSKTKLTCEHFDKESQVIPLELALSILCNFNWVTK